MLRFNSSLAAGIAAVGLFLSSSSPVVAASAAEVTPAQISAAHTPAEHEAIASQYDTAAARAEAQATEHEAMVQSYRVAARGAKGEMARSMVAHCEALVKEYREASANYKTLAADHRKMAAEASR
jgi:hypothetical protein